MSAGILATDTMAHTRAGGNPWHNLATAIIDPSDDFDTAWEKGGLTWTVSKQVLQFLNRDGLLEEVDRVAVVRDDTGAVLGTHGEGWEAYQNTEMRDTFLRPMVDSGLVTLETMGSLFGGKRVWALARINRGGQEIVKGDLVNPYVLCGQGYDGTMSAYFGGTAVRVVCANTEAAALEAGGQVRVRHTKNMRNAIGCIRDAIMQSIDNFDKTCDMFRALASKSYNNDQLTTYLNTLFPKARTDESVKAEALADAAAAQVATRQDDGVGILGDLLNRPYSNPNRPAQDMFARREVVASRAHDRILEILGSDAGGQQMPGVAGTAWGAYNAVTNFLTHERGRSADGRMSTLAFGGANGIGAKALDAAADAFLS